MVSRRQLLSASLAAPLLATSGRGSAARPPNIILLMVDDLSAREFGCYGHPVHQTPTIDGLAASGTCFRTCWTTPICRSSRALIMTGRYGFRTGHYHNAMTPPVDDPRRNIGLTNFTFAHVLGAAGYRSAICGKWQLTGTPKQYGFDEHCLWQGHAGYEGPVETASDGAHPGRPARYWHPAVVRNGSPLQTTPDDYGPDLFLDFVLDFAERRRPGPFFIYYPMCLSHVSWDYGQEMETYLAVPEVDARGERTGERRPGSLRSNVEYFDHMLQRLVRGLDDLGLRERTILVVTGDNGTLGYGKDDVVRERGPQVPMIVNAPDIVLPRGLVDDLVDHSDILPTLAEFASATLPGGYQIDGRSFAASLQGRGGASRSWIFSYLGDRRFLRDRQWLLDGNGLLWFCGERRDGRGYLDMSESQSGEARSARRRFDALLEQLPSPPPQVVSRAWRRRRCSIPTPITL